MNASFAAKNSYVPPAVPGKDTEEKTHKANDPTAHGNEGARKAEVTEATNAIVAVNDCSHHAPKLSHCNGIAPIFADMKAPTCFATLVDDV